MPYTTPETGTVADGKVQLGAELDNLVATGVETMQDAMQLAQSRGLTTGPGPNSYMAPGLEAAEAATLNEQSRQSAARSAAYQATRIGNPEGYTQASQAAFNLSHPLNLY